MYYDHKEQHISLKTDQDIYQYEYLRRAKEILFYDYY